MIPIDNWRTLDNYGNVMPWYTRPCLEWLIDVDLNGKNVFEYGCGVSTTWFNLRGAITHGVDHSNEWMPDDSRHILTSEKGLYINYSIHRPKVKYFLIIIDGLHRDDCTEVALRYLEKGGYLIADNFEQPSAELPDWPKTRELTKHLPLTIYKEPNHMDWKTAVWHNI